MDEKKFHQHNSDKLIEAIEDITLLEQSESVWLENIKKLLPNCDLNRPNSSGIFPFIAIIATNRKDLFDLILSYHLNINQRNTDFPAFTPLLQACVGGNEHIIETLLKQKADCEQADKMGNTPLHKVVFFNHEKAARLLIQYGADYTIKNNEQQTPLDIALSKNHIDITAAISDEITKRDRKAFFTFLCCLYHSKHPFRNRDLLLIIYSYFPQKIQVGPEKNLVLKEKTTELTSSNEGSGCCILM